MWHSNWRRFARIQKRCGLPWLVLIAWAGYGQLLTGQVVRTATFEKVLLSGEQAPGFPKGVTFNPVGIPGGVFVAAPTIGPDGTIGFSGLTATSFPFTQALWLSGKAGFERLAASGDAAPGTNSTFFSFPSIYFVDAPQAGFLSATFHGSLSDPFAEAFSGTWLRDEDGSLRLVVLSGDAVPGIPGAIFRYVSALQTGNGSLLAVGQYTPSGGSSSNEHEGFWRDDGAGLVRVISDNMPAPGTPPGVKFGKGTGLAFWATFDEWGHNRLGQLAFNAYLTGTGVNELNDEGIWAEDAQGLYLLIREGDPAPHLGPGAVMRLASGFRTFGTVHHIGAQINDRGSVVFSGSFSGPGYDFGEGMWVNRHGDLELVAYAFPPSEGIGGPAPGLPGHVFVDFTSAAFNHFDEIAFQGYAYQGATSTQGIWWDVPGGLSLVARAGGSVPDAPGAAFNSLRLEALSDQGQLVFSAFLQGSAIQPLVNDRGLYLANRQGKLGTILRRGESIDLYGNGKDIRVIADWTQGRPNEKLQLPLLLKFTDGSSGIFRVDVQFK